MFPTLSEYLINETLYADRELARDIQQHLDSLVHYFDEYFLNDNIDNFEIGSEIRSKLK